jgi:hypothetical protein
MKIPKTDIKAYIQPILCNPLTIQTAFTTIPICYTLQYLTFAITVIMSAIVLTLISRIIINLIKTLVIIINPTITNHTIIIISIILTISNSSGCNIICIRLITNEEVNSCWFSKKTELFASFSL